MYEFKNITPQYIQMPQWDVSQVFGKNNKDELPKESIDYIKYIEAQTGLKIIGVSTGPERNSYISF